MADLFPCERKGCGHPLNRHDPCNAVIVAGKKAHLCKCQAYEPAKRKATVARLTDVQLLPPGRRPS
jgi:hypothetical protein